MVGFVVAGGAIYYLLFIQDHPATESMRAYWKNHFLPIDSGVTAEQWLSMKWHGLFKDDLSFDYHVQIIKLFFLAGLTGSFFLKKPVWILIIPALIHWIASGFELYPVDTRLTLYYHSGIIILLAHGIQLPARLLYSKILVGLVFTLYLMVPSLERSWENLGNPDMASIFDRYWNQFWNH